MLDGMADMGTAHAEKAEQARASCRSSPRSRRRASTAASAATCSRWSSTSCTRLASPTRRSTAAGSGSPPPSPRRRCRPPSRASARPSPRAGDKELHVGVATVGAGHRRAARLLRRPGLPRLPDQLGRRRRHGRIDVQAVHAGHRARGRLLPQGHLRGQLAVRVPRRPHRSERGRPAPTASASYGEAVNATTALEESINTAYVDMSNSMANGPTRSSTPRRGPRRAADRADQYPGIPPSRTSSPTRGHPGQGPVSPINMANAYATIANGGKRADVHVIEKVVDQTGETRYGHKQRTTKGLREDIAADVVLRHAAGRPERHRPRALRSGRPAAGKTGTATNDKDQVSSAWFVGYTPQLATAVMYVRGDGDDQLDGWLPSYFGADYPAETWTAVMTRGMEGLEVEEFPPPANVDGEAPIDGHAPSTPPPTRPAPPRRADRPRSSADQGADAAAADARPRPAAAAPDRPSAPTDRRPPTDAAPTADRAAAAEPPTGPPANRGHRANAGASRRRRPARPVARGPLRPERPLWPWVVAPGGPDERPHAGRPGRRRAQRGHRRAGRRARRAPPVVDPGPRGAGADRGLLRAGHGAEGPVLRGRLAATAPARYTHMCYSDLPYLYTGRGFAELNWPYTDDAEVRARYEVMEYPVAISYWAWATAWVTHWLNGSPDLSTSAESTADALFGRPGECAGDPALRRRQRAGLRGGHPARRLVPHRRQPAPALGRGGVRAVTRAGADRPGQLGPARGRARRPGRSGPGRAAGRCSPAC